MKNGYYTTHELREARREFRQKDKEARVLYHYALLLKKGMQVKKAIAQISRQYDISRRTLYRYVARHSIL